MLQEVRRKKLLDPSIDHLDCDRVWRVRGHVLDPDVESFPMQVHDYTRIANTHLDRDITEQVVK